MQGLRNLGLNRLLRYNQSLLFKYMDSAPYCATTVDCIDALTYHTIISDRKPKDSDRKIKTNLYNDAMIRYFSETESDMLPDVNNLTGIEIDNALLDIHKRNCNRELFKFIDQCLENRVMIGKDALKTLLRSFSSRGKVIEVDRLRNYCFKVIPFLYEKNGEFLHYAAKAQCYKGNSDKGLSILMEAYEKHTKLRGFYRIIIKELIHDSVMNRSEASVVTFKKYVLLLSTKWNDIYPLVCFWHICWKSDWFSDQMLANELLESSEGLQNIIKETSATLCLNVLKEFNEDAVTRLLQSLLKFKMMDEYTNVLQILFNFKLRQRDMRGCTEILRNCDALGISLPSSLQNRFIQFFIGRKDSDTPKPTKRENFKLKF